MNTVLLEPLAYRLEMDEFQIGRRLVWVYHLDGDERALKLSRGNSILPVIQADIQKVEAVESRISGEDMQVLGMSIKSEGSTIYTCRWDDDEDSIDIVRSVDVRLTLL